MSDNKDNNGVIVVRSMEELVNHLQKIIGKGFEKSVAEAKNIELHKHAYVPKTEVKGKPKVFIEQHQYFVLKQLSKPNAEDSKYFQYAQISTNISDASKLKIKVISADKYEGKKAVEKIVMEAQNTMYFEHGYNKYTLRVGDWINLKDFCDNYEFITV